MKCADVFKRESGRKDEKGHRGIEKKAGTNLNSLLSY